MAGFFCLGPAAGGLFSNCCLKHPLGMFPFAFLFPSLPPTPMLPLPPPLLPKPPPPLQPPLLPLPMPAPPPFPPCSPYVAFGRPLLLFRAVCLVLAIFFGYKKSRNRENRMKNMQKVQFIENVLLRTYRGKM